MDNEQAKLILSAYRPGGQDASDPFFAEALAQARMDPELSAWFAAQRQIDQIACEALQAVTPPHGLRESLLIDRKVVRMSDRIRGQRWTRPTSWMAVAALVFFLLGIGLLMQPHFQEPQPMNRQQFAEVLYDLTATGNITLGKMASNQAELRAWLAEQGAPHDFPVPDSLHETGSIGCQSFDFNGAKVSLLCFMLDKDQLVHLFVIDDHAIADPPGQVPVIMNQGKAVAAVWSSEGRTFFMTGTNLDEATLRRLI